MNHGINEMKFRVLFIGVSNYDQPLDATEEKKFTLLEKIADVKVLAFSNQLKPKCFFQKSYFYLLPGIKNSLLRYLLIVIIGSILATWLVLQKRIDFIVAQSPYEALAGYISKRIARLFGSDVYLIIEAHGDFENFLFVQNKVFLAGFTRKMMSLIAHLTLTNADALRAVSNSTEGLLKKIAPTKPLIKFPGWTDIDVFLEQTKINSKENFIVFAGSLIPLKGVHILISAFATISKHYNLQLVIIGPADNVDYFNKLNKQINNLSLSKYVYFTGKVSQAELAVWMRRARVVVLTSLTEGLGRVIFEAMATSTPVIASRIGGIPDIIRDGENGFLFEPGNEIELAEKLCWLFDNPDKANLIGQRGYQYSRELFSSNIYLNGYDELFKVARK